MYQKTKALFMYHYKFNLQPFSLPKCILYILFIMTIKLHHKKTHQDKDHLLWTYLVAVQHRTTLQYHVAHTDHLDSSQLMD